MSQELKQVEATIEDAEKYLKFSIHEGKLSKNESFKKIIMEGYFKDEAARLAGMLAEPQMADELNQREITSALKAIGHLRQYLINIHRTHVTLETSLQDHKNLADEIRSEGA